VVASVSCIYGLGTPQEYVDRMLELQQSVTSYDRDSMLRRFVEMQYTATTCVHPRQVPGAR
jgi:excinuclease ABC subunit B